MSRTGIGIGLTLIALGLIVMGIARTRPVDISPHEDYGHAPEFALTESSGRSMSLQDLRGKVWIADFIFTSCAGSCPIMSSQMQRLQASLPQNIRFVSFSVDPARDTPAVLADYAKKYSADSRRWSFLTGDRKTLSSIVMQGFKLPLDDTQGSELEPITHSSRFVLVGKDSTIAGYFDSDEDGLKRLGEAARQLQ